MTYISLRCGFTVIIVVIVALVGCGNQERSDKEFVRSVFGLYFEGKTENFYSYLSRENQDSLGFIRSLGACRQFNDENTDFTVLNNAKGHKGYRFWVVSKNDTISVEVLHSDRKGDGRKVRVYTKSLVNYLSDDTILIQNCLNDLFLSGRYFDLVQMIYVLNVNGSGVADRYCRLIGYERLGSQNQALLDSLASNAYYEPIHYYVEHLRGNGKIKQALDLYMRLSKLGDPKSAYLLGRYLDHYYVSRGFYNIPEEYKDINYLELYKQAAKAGYERAYFGIGNCFRFGGVYCEKNLDSAAIYLERAGKAGTFAAFVDLGEIFIDQGDGERALDYLQRAYDGGYHTASFEIGYVYEMFYGNLEKAVEWYRIGWEEHSSYRCYRRLKKLDDSYKKEDSDPAGARLSVTGTRASFDII